MSTYKHQPDYAVPPGLEEYLEARCFTRFEFARRCGCSTMLVNEILAGDAAVERATALQFERVLGMDARIWLGLEADYRSRGSIWALHRLYHLDTVTHQVTKSWRGAVEVEFKKRSLAKVLNSEREVVKRYGPRMAKVLRTRLGALQNAPNLATVPTGKPMRRHLLRSERAGQFAVDLVHPYRLVFEPDHAPVPRLPDGGVDTERVTAITITEVVDYH